MTGFAPRPDQDASPSILGYVYQAEVSILEWLGLSKGEALELELGEDLARFASEYGRGALTLTQVKKVSEPLTLRRPYALKFLADSAYHDVQPANSGIDLSFIYLTTAGVGKERGKGSRLPNGASGVDLWESIRGAALDPEAGKEALQALRALFSHCKKPKRKVSDASWRAWEAKLAAEESLLDFCRRLRWSTSATEPKVVTKQILDKIEACGLAAGPAASLNLHRNLFVHVFRLLSQPGEKRLVSEDLPTIATKELLGAEKALLERLEEDCPPLKVLFQDLRSEVRATNESVKQVAREVSEARCQLVDVHADVKRLVARGNEREVVQRLEVTTLIQQVQTAYRDHEGALDTLQRFLVGKELIRPGGEDWQELQRLRDEVVTTTERFLNAHAEAASSFLGKSFPEREYREKLGGELCELVDDAVCREGPIQERLEPRHESAYRDTIWKAYDRLQPLEIGDLAFAQTETWNLESSRLKLNNSAPLALNGQIVEVVVQNRSAGTIEACAVKAVLVEGGAEVSLPSVGANDIHPNNTAGFRLLLHGSDERGDRAVVLGPPTRPTATTLPYLDGGHLLYPAPDRLELELRVFANNQPSLRRRFLLPFE